MVRQNLFASIIIFLMVFAGYSANDKSIRAQEQEIIILKNSIAQARDSLEYETTRRYSLKQQLMEQRQVDKDEFDRLRDEQERVSNQLAQIKEESLVKEQQLLDERKQTNEKKDSWNIVSTTLGEQFQKETGAITEAFPVDRIERQASFETVRSFSGGDHGALSAWSKYVDYKLNWIQKGSKLSVSYERLLTDEGVSATMSFARFGNVLGYGLDTSMAAYVVRQTGRLGADRYAIDKIASQELLSYIIATLPGWMKAGKPYGMLMADVIQNEQSRLLISGKKTSWWSASAHSLRQGGAIMVPLLLLPFWIMYLVLRKVFQIYGRKRRFKKQFVKVQGYFSADDYSGALAWIAAQKGAMARMLQTCLEHRGKDRGGCERVVREIIYREIPIINRSINTVAVIAGAAPLLGLLGTISGMITLFAAVTNYGTGDPKFLAGGISEALITAKTGLAIAIPALFLHDWLRGSKEALLADIEEYVGHTINQLWPEG